MELPEALPMASITVSSSSQACVNLTTLYASYHTLPPPSALSQSLLTVSSHILDIDVSQFLRALVPFLPELFAIPYPDNPQGHEMRTDCGVLDQVCQFESSIKFHQHVSRSAVSSSWALGLAPSLHYYQQSAPVHLWRNLFHNPTLLKLTSKSSDD